MELEVRNVQVLQCHQIYPEPVTTRCLGHTRVHSRLPIPSRLATSPCPTPPQGARSHARKGPHFIQMYKGPDGTRGASIPGEIRCGEIGKSVRKAANAMASGGAMIRRIRQALTPIGHSTRKYAAEKEMPQTPLHPPSPPSTPRP